MTAEALLPYALVLQLVINVVVVLAFIGLYRGLIGLEQDIADTNKRFRKLYDDMWAGKPK